MKSFLPPAAEQFAIEIKALRMRLSELPELAATVNQYTHNALIPKVNDAHLLADAIVQRSEAEERLLYPLAPEGIPADISALLDDHRHLRDLANGIARWNPLLPRDRLAALLNQFYQVADIHLFVEARLFLPLLQRRDVELFGKANHERTAHRSAA